MRLVFIKSAKLIKSYNLKFKEVVNRFACSTCIRNVTFLSATFKLPGKGGVDVVSAQV